MKAQTGIRESNIEGEQGYDVPIRCHVKGVPFPTIRWHRNAASLPGNAEVKKKRQMLLIKNAKREDSGEYVCNAENYLRNSTDVVNVRITQRLSFFFKSPHITQSIKSENISIYCFHEYGAHPVNITWLKDGKAVANKALLTKNNQVLTISNIDLGDQGSYKCIVRSKFLTLRHVMRIIVHPKTCSDVRRAGKRKSGNYIIYALGRSPVQVSCDMTSMNNKGITVISHNSEARILVQGFDPAASYRKKITYNIPMQNVKAIIASSTICEQFIKYECYNSAMYIGSYAWWVSSSGQKMTN